MRQILPAGRQRWRLAGPAKRSTCFAKSLTNWGFIAQGGLARSLLEGWRLSISVKGRPLSSVTPSTPSVATQANRPARTSASSASGEDFATLLDSAPTPEPAAAPAEPPRSSADPARTEAGKGKPARADGAGKARGAGDKAANPTAKDAAEGAAGDREAGAGTPSVAATVAAMVAPVLPAAPAAPAPTGTIAPAETAEQLALTAIGGTATATAATAAPGDATATAATEAAPAAAAAATETAPTPAQTATGLVAGNAIAAHLPAIGATRLAGGNAAAVPGLSPATGTASTGAADTDLAAEPADAQAAEPDTEAGAKPDAKPGAEAKADGEAGADKARNATPQSGPESGRAGKAEAPAGNLRAGAEAIPPTVSAAPDGTAQPSGATPVLAQAHLATAATATPQVTVMPPAVAVPPAGLALAIASQARAGHSRFDIQLEPAELGRIDVRLSIDRHGTVTSHVVVEKAETLDLLRRDAPHLQRALDDAGLKTGSGGLQFSLRDQTPQQRDDGGRATRPRIVIADDVIAAETAGRNYGRPLHASSGLDIRV